MRRPGVEPGSPPWQGGVVATGPTARCIEDILKRLLISFPRVILLLAVRCNLVKQEHDCGVGT